MLKYWLIISTLILFRHTMQDLNELEALDKKDTDEN